MASSATTIFRLQKMEHAITTLWGDKVNVNMDQIDSALGGTEAISTTGGTTTLTNVDFVNDQAKKRVLQVTGTLVSNATIVIPNTSRLYKVINGTSGAFTLTIKTLTGSGKTVTQGAAADLHCDGSNVILYVGCETVTGTGAPQTASGAAASAVSVSAITNMSATNAQAALAELQADITTMAGSGTPVALTIGTTVQAYDADLATIAGLTKTKGNLIVGDGTNWSAVAAGSDGFMLIANSSAASGTVWAPGSGNTAINAGVSASVAANALTVNLRDAAGATPSSTSPVLIPFRSATAATGTITLRAITAATSLVISSGSTMGFTSATAGALWLVAFDDAGTVRLGLINCRTSALSIFPLGAFPIASSTAEGGAGAADNAQVFYTGTAVSSKAYTILARLSWETGLTTAGTWNVGPTRVELVGPHTHLPGSVVQTQRVVDGARNTGVNTIPLDNTTPQSTEGVNYIQLPITPVSAANKLRIQHGGEYDANTANTALTVALFQDSTADALATSLWAKDGASGSNAAGLLTHEMLAATTATTTFKIHAGAASAGTIGFNSSGAAAIFNGTHRSFVVVEEIAA